MALPQAARPPFAEHKVQFFEPAYFQAAASHSHTGYDLSGAVSAVLPHHLFAADILSEFYESLAKSRPGLTTVFLVGPNHGSVGCCSFLTSDESFRGETGAVLPHVELVRELETIPRASLDRAAVHGDHSVVGHMPYLAKYLPGVRVVPVIVKTGVSEEDLSILSRWLAERQGPSTFVLSSVDFSHYLNARAAEQMDTETKRAIRAFDYEILLSFGNSHLDSPGSLVVAMKVSQLLGSSRATIHRNENSGALMQNLEGQTTSYVIASFGSGGD